MKPIVLLGALAIFLTNLSIPSGNAVAGAVDAPDDTGAWYVSPLVQWWDLDSRRRAAGHVAGQFALGYAYDETWDVEGAIAGASVASYCGCTLKLITASLDWLYKFGADARAQPYIIAGFGVMHDVVDRSPSSTGPTAEAGAGLRAPFGHASQPLWQWRAEVKYRREFSDKTATRASVGDIVAGVGLQYNFR